MSLAPFARLFENTKLYREFDVRMRHRTPNWDNVNCYGCAFALLRFNGLCVRLGVDATYTPFVKR